MNTTEHLLLLNGQVNNNAVLWEHNPIAELPIPVPNRERKYNGIIESKNQEP